MNNPLFEQAKRLAIPRPVFLRISKSGGIRAECPFIPPPPIH